jgi:hypothetical protein
LAVGLVTTGIIAQAQNWPMPGQAKAPAKSRASDSNEKPRPDAEAAVRRVTTPAEDRTETVTYRGRVVGPDGRPVADAKLYLTLAVGYSMKPSSSPVYATTGPDGGFNFTVPKTKFGDQSTDLAAAAPNYGAGWVTLGNDTPKNDLKLQLVADGLPIKGQVIDLEGKPVPGATLRVLQINAASGEDLGPWLEATKDRKAPDRDRSLRLEQQYLPRYTVALSPAATTGADGHLRLTGIGRNRLVLLQLDGPTIASQYLRILTRPGNTIEVPGYKGNPESRIPRTVTTYYGASFRHVAAPTKPIVGVVRDKETKKPLAGVKIHSYTLATRPNHIDHIIETTTDAAGRYQLRGMPKGEGNKIMLVPLHDQPYLPVHAKVPDSPGLDPVAVDFALKRGVWIEGKITDKVTGKPLKAGAEYFALWANPNVRDYEGFDGTVLIGGNGSSGNSDGTYRVVGLPGPGLVVVWRVDDYLLALERDDEFRIEKKGLSTAPYQLLPLQNYGAFARIDPPKAVDSVKRDVTLDPGWTFTGTVLGPDGKPLAGTRSNGLTGWGWRNKEGTETAEFTVRGFNPRRPHDLFFRQQETGLVGLAQPPKKNGGTITVQMQPGARVTGRLVDAAGRQRAGVELEVSFRLKDDSSWWLLHSPKRIKTDREGRFEIEALLPGYEFRLSDGESELPLTGPFHWGQTKDLGDVRPRPSHKSAG